MRFALSPRQRWQLAQLFLHQDLRVGGVEEIKRFNRARLALRLAEPMRRLADGLDVDPEMMAEDALAAFELDDAAIDFLLAHVAPLPMLGFQAAGLGDFVAALETAKLLKQAPPVEDVPDLDAEKEQWAPAEHDLVNARKRKRTG